MLLAILEVFKKSIHLGGEVWSLNRELTWQIVSEIYFENVECVFFLKSSSLVNWKSVKPYSKDFYVVSKSIFKAIAKW